MLTTEKDLVKLEQVGAVTDLPLYALRMEVQAEEQFLQSILAGFAPQTNGDGEEKCPTVVKSSHLVAGGLLCAFCNTILRCRLLCG